MPAASSEVRTGIQSLAEMRSAVLPVYGRRNMPSLSLPSRHVRYSLAGLRGERAHLMTGAHVIADRLQPFENALPLRPIELPQERPETLNKWVFEYGLTVRFRNKETVQTDSQSFSNLFERAEAGCHLPAFDSGKIRT